jgi:hypothetical protein
MKNWKFVICTLIAASAEACNTSIPKEDASEIGLDECKKQPEFFKNSGFDLKRCALSTSEKKITGLVLLELPLNPIDSNRHWQHPSWSKFGFMGPMAIDDEGNTYVAPIPVVNILKNNPKEQNTIYRVDYVTGQMEPLLNLKSDSISETNVYGLMGLCFDCHAGLLLASSVAGSTRTIVKGKLYLIDPKTKTIIDELEGFDAIGVGICGITGIKRAYFGLARKSEIWSVEIDKNNHFKGEPKLEISLDLLGPRGDDKARKIRFNTQGEMLVSGVEFNFNLTAPTEKQETKYQFIWNNEETKWEFVK